MMMVLKNKKQMILSKKKVNAIFTLNSKKVKNAIWRRNLIYCRNNVIYGNSRRIEGDLKMCYHAYTPPCQIREWNIYPCS